RRERAGFSGCYLNGVGGHAPAALVGEKSRGATKHFERTGDVEDLCVGKGEHDDSACAPLGSGARELDDLVSSFPLHGRIVARGRTGSNRYIATVTANRGY